jgi:hypothetical protein
MNSDERRAMSRDQEASNDADSPAALALQAELEGLAEAIRCVTVQVRVGRRGGASGVIWTADGLVVTAAHVGSGGSPCGGGAGGRAGVEGPPEGPGS